MPLAQHWCLCACQYIWQRCRMQSKEQKRSVSIWQRKKKPCGEIINIAQCCVLGIFLLDLPWHTYAGVSCRLLRFAPGRGAGPMNHRLLIKTKWSRQKCWHAKCVTISCLSISPREDMKLRQCMCRFKKGLCMKHVAVCLLRVYGCRFFRYPLFVLQNFVLPKCCVCW